MDFRYIKIAMICVGVFGLFAILVVTAVYFANFSGLKSADHEVWGTFGDYVGGTLNPLLSFCALISLILALVLQSKELEQSRMQLSKAADAHELQARYYAIEQQREDIHRLVSILSARLNKNYNENRLDGDHSIHKCLMGSSNINQNEVLREVIYHAGRSESKTYRIFGYVTSDLEQLKELLIKYQELTNQISSGSPYADFYKSEYKEMVERFFEADLFKKDIYEFYCSKFTTGA